MVSLVLALTACTESESLDEGVTIELHETRGGSADASGAIATLQTRDFKLGVHAGDGPTARRFTVTRSSGQVVASRVSLDELTREYPALARQYETALAKNAGEGLPYAGL